MVKYPRGSEWRKWDLHVHTPLDHEWIARKQFSTEAEKIQYAKEYISFALSENISVLAITDHNFCNKLSDSLLPYIIAEAVQNNITILPGFEITVKDGSGIHLLVIFKEETDLSLIFKIVERLFPANEALIPSTGMIPVSQKSMDELKKELDDSNLDHLLVFAHADRDNGVLDSETIAGTRRVQEWQKSYISICQLSKAKHEFTVGSFLHNVFSKSDRNYAREMTYIVASDCRSIEKGVILEGRHYLGQKFTWIKADPTFEGLRQIKYEPDLRVSISEKAPNEKIPYNVIKEIRFIMDEAESPEDFTPIPIMLNPDLNVIIGGKSSGKSLLLYNIANTIDHIQTCKKEDGIDDKKREDKYSFKKRKIGFEVTWQNGVKQLLSQNTDTAHGLANYSILYVPQSYIQKLADIEGRKTRKEVGKIIRDILLQKEESKNHYDIFISEVKRLDIVRENLISQYITALDIYKASLVHIQGIGDKNAINQYVEQLETKIVALKQSSEISIQQQEEYNLYRSQIQTLNTHAFELKNDKEKIQQFNTSFSRSIAQLINGKNELLQELKNIAVRTGLEKVFSPLDTLQSIAIDIESKVLKDDDGSINQATFAILQQVNAINEKLEPLSALFEKREEIEKLEMQIASELLKIDKINAYEEEVKIKEKQKNHAKILLLEAYKETYKQYIEIVGKLNERGLEIKGKLKLNGYVKFYTKRMYERLKESINNTQSSSLIDSNPLFQNPNELKNVANEDDLNLVLEQLSLLFDHVIENRIVLKSAVSKKDALNVLFKDVFFDYWEILVDRDEIANMSPGKAGLVLLKLLIELSDSKCPILIDQPEDNLDNRSIYSDLVQYIRDKKSQRQFIVVTHNPNIVVGADAENVIVANQNDQDPARVNSKYQFDYISGALENILNKDDSITDILTSMGIREHVTEILEGGKEAFQKREAKYRYNISM